MAIQIQNSEARIQKDVVMTIGLVYPKFEVIANPLSELELNYNNQRAKAAKLQNAKAMGWKASQPDLLILTPGDSKNVAIELKRPSKNPFRPFRKGPEMWIDKTESFHELEHVMSQLAYLSKLGKLGFNSFLLDNSIDCMDAITGTVYNPDQLESFSQYSFSYGVEPDCKVFYKCRPEHY